LEFNILVRELTPFEHLVCEHLCEGMTNSAIAKATAHTEKVVENTVSRSAHAFSIKSTGEHLTVGPNGEQICSQHIE